MKTKWFIRIVLVLLPISVLIFFDYSGRTNYKKFYNSTINSKIIRRDNWQKRATEFYLDNELSIDSSAFNKIDLKEGDSVVKEMHTNLFTVYRKADGNYIRLGKFKFIR